MYVRPNQTYTGAEGAYKAAFDMEVLWLMGHDCGVSGPYSEVAAMRRGLTPRDAAWEAVAFNPFFMRRAQTHGWRCQ